MRIEDLCTLVTSGGTPLRSEMSYWNDGTIPWLKTGEIKKQFIYDVEEKITVKGLEGSSAKLIPQNSVIIAMYGDGETAGQVAVNKIELSTNQACCNLVIDKNKAHYLYVYYYLKGNYENLTNLKLGGSQQNLNLKAIKNFHISCPSLESQKKIAAILTSYDELIENNNRRITLLEKMAEELYREWFVRLRFPGHEQTKVVKGVPEGWTIKKLPDVATITYGFPFESSRFNTHRIGKPIIRIRNIPDSKITDYTDEQADEKYIVRRGDILIGMDGEFHVNRWYEENALLVQRSCRLKAKRPILDEYLYRAIVAPVKFFEAIIQGATVSHLGAKHLNSIEILIPPPHLSNCMEELNCLKDQIVLFQTANNKLKSTRDRLLPRLISGKLDVDRLDIAFPKNFD